MKGLYRGKRKDNGEWVYGAYIVMHHNDKRTHLHHFIIPDNGDLSFGVKVEDILVEVIPETVGQCMGKEDKTGKQIFEGDIVVSTNSNRLSDRPHVVTLDLVRGSCYITDDREPKIVGNIHDSPTFIVDYMKKMYPNLNCWR